MKKVLVVAVILFFCLGVFSQPVGRILNIDTIQLDGSTISTTSTNQDLTISPDGTGTVIIDTDLDVDNVNINGNSIISSDTNGDLTLDANGTGEIVLVDEVLVGDSGGDGDHTINGASVSSALEVHTSGGSSLGGISTHRLVDSATLGAHFVGYKARGTTGSPAIVQSGDIVQRDVSAAFDGVDYELLAEMRTNIDGTPGSNDMPGRIGFFTTPDGSVTLTEALRIDSGQDTNIMSQNELRFQDTTGGEYMGFKAPSTVTASTTFTLPDGDGADGQALTTNGSGTLAWSAAGGAGGIGNNYYNMFAIENSGVEFRFETAVTGWTGTTTAPVLETTDEIEGVGSIAWTPAGADQLRSDALTIPDWLHGQNGLIEFVYQGGDNGYTLKVLDGSNAEIESSCNEDFANQTSNANVYCTFVFPTSGSIKISLEVSLSATKIIGDLAYLGFNYLLGDAALIGEWMAYTPTGTFTTNTTYTGFYKRSGDTIEGRVTLDFTGAPNSTTLNTVSLPSGLTIDTAKLSNTSTDQSLGNATVANTGINLFPGETLKDSGNTVRPAYHGATGTGLLGITQAAPFTIGSGDQITFDYKLPITEWSTTGKAVKADDSDNPWTTGTCASSWVTNTTVTCQWRRVGEEAHIKMLVSASGAVTAANLTVDIPSELPVIDTAKLLSTVADEQAFGVVKVLNSGVAAYPGALYYSDTNTVGVQVYDSASTYAFTTTVTNAVPITFGASDSVNIDFKVPITGWSASQRAPLLVNSVVSTYEGVTRFEAADINCDSGSAITSQHGTWVSSVGNVSAGACTITLVTGVFSGTPYCVAVENTGSTPRIVTTAPASATSVVIDCRSDGGTDCTSYNAQLMCMGPN